MTLYTRWVEIHLEDWFGHPRWWWLCNIPSSLHRHHVENGKCSRWPALERWRCHDLDMYIFCCFPGIVSPQIGDQLCCRRFKHSQDSSPRVGRRWVRYNFHQWRDGPNLQDGPVGSRSDQTFSQKVVGSVFRSWVRWKQSLKLLLTSCSSLKWLKGSFLIWFSGVFQEQEDNFGTCYVPSHIDHLQFLMRPLRYLDCSACGLGLSVEPKSSRVPSST